MYIHTIVFQSILTVLVAIELSQIDLTTNHHPPIKMLSSS